MTNVRHHNSPQSHCTNQCSFKYKNCHIPTTATIIKNPWTSVKLSKQTAHFSHYVHMFSTILLWWKLMFTINTCQHSITAVQQMCNFTSINVHHCIHNAYQHNTTAILSICNFISCNVQGIITKCIMYKPSNLLQTSCIMLTDFTLLLI